MMADKAKTSGISPAIISQLKLLKTEFVEPLDFTEPVKSIEPIELTEPVKPTEPTELPEPVKPIETLKIKLPIKRIELIEPIKTKLPSKLTKSIKSTMEPKKPTKSEQIKLTQPSKLSKLKDSKTKLTELKKPSDSLSMEPPDPISKREYNLRSRFHHVKKKYKYQPETTDKVVWVSKGKNCFRDLLLVQTDLQDYHKHKTDTAQKIVDQFKTLQKSQIDSFVIGSNKFLAIACLSTLRLFEYKSNYVEVKRLPQRYISLDPNLITSVHYSESKFFIAHLWGDNEDTSDDEEGDRNLTSPYIVVRDVAGKRIGKPYHYDKVIRSIYTDDFYLYALSSQDVLYVHQKALYSFSNYRIDFSNYITGPLMSAWIWNSSYDSYTIFHTIAATSSEIILTQFDTQRHKKEASWPIEENYLVVSIENLQKKFLIHQNIKDLGWDKPGSKIEIIKPNTKEVIKKIELHYRILQVKAYNETIYLFGFKKLEEKAIFEVGLIDFKLNPLSTVILPPEVDVDFRLLVHDGHFALVKNSSTIITISTTTAQPCTNCAIRIPECDKLKHKALDHRTMFTGMVSDDKRRKLSI